MAHAATVEPMTTDDFLSWEANQPTRHEFVDNEIFAMVGVTRQHATVAGNVFAVLKQHLKGTPCRVYMADMKVKLQTANAFFYPDVFVTCSEQDHQAELFMSEPRLIVEVLSESTEAYDRGDKFEKYRQFASLQEYMLINPIKRKVDSFRLDNTGHWVLYEFDGDAPIEFESVGLVLDNIVLYEDV
ncbi:Uma2 family endonuclease [Crenothrix sp.]|uniref:Uma2 family endonuclease n=1 Tax=Crenothrix sp. TaxID=3100433 RepID=UPI00374D7984